MKPMKVDTFSKQQLKVLSWWCKESRYKNYDAIICDGAVRSGKTFCMSISVFCVELLQLCKFGFCPLRKDYSLSAQKYGNSDNSRA